MKDNQALLIVDVQIDFCPGGALPVAQGDEIVPIVNQYIQIFQRKRFSIFASRDWHPPKTSHFLPYGGLWPVHCVKESKGSRFHPHLRLPKSTIVFSKGMDPKKDSYSAFQAFDDRKRSFLDIVKEKNITTLYIGGLATDYCVRSTVLDALKECLNVWLLVDAIRGVNRKPGDSKKALKEMLRSGAQEMTLEQCT